MSQASTQSPIEEVVNFFARGPSTEEIATVQLSEATQDRLRELLRRNARGELGADEGCQLDQMMLLDDIISLIRVRAQRTGGSPGDVGGSKGA